MDTPVANKKPHLSVSQLEMMSRCGEQYRRRYVLGEKIPPGVSALVGRGVDSSVDSNLTHKVREGVLLPEEAVQDYARDAFASEWEQGVKLTDREISSGVREIYGKGLDKSVRLASLHAGDLAPEIEPLSEEHIQRWWRISVQGSPRDLVGVMDIQERGRVIDTKTSAKSPPKTVIDKSLQGTAYLLASQVTDPPEERAEEFRLDYLVDTKTPKTVQMTGVRDEGDYQALARRIEAATIALERGSFIPADTGSWICDPRYCGYYSTCPYVSGRTLVALSS